MAARAQMKWLRRGFERNLSVVAVLVLWEITTRAGVFNNFLLPPLSKVLMRGWSDVLNGEIPRQMLATGTVTLIGFAIAALSGVAAGAIHPIGFVAGNGTAVSFEMAVVREPDPNCGRLGRAVRVVFEHVFG